MRRATLPLHVGGFMGPFGGGVLAVLIPQLRDAFDASTAAVSAAIPAYLVPYAVCQLVSGTIGERLGRRRVVRAGYVAYALAFLAAAAATAIGPFLLARAVQGVANAFLTPLLLAGLAELVPAAVALALVLVPPPAAARGGDAASVPRLRAVLTRRVGLLSAAGFLAFASGVGLSFVVALEAADAFGLDSTARGTLLAGFGIAGMLFGRVAGGLADRVGRVPVAVAGCLATGALVALLGLAGSPLVLAALWFGAGVGSALVWAGLNTLAVEAVPSNRAGATSVISAFKFAGYAAGPVLWLPLYASHPRLAFGAAGAAAALTAALVLAARARPADDGRVPPLPPAPAAERTARR